MQQNSAAPAIGENAKPAILEINALNNTIQRASSPLGADLNQYAPSNRNKKAISGTAGRLENPLTCSRVRWTTSSITGASATMK